MPSLRELKEMGWMSLAVGTTKTNINQILIDETKLHTRKSNMWEVNNPRVTAIAIHFLDGIERSKDFSYNQLLDIKHLLYTWIDVLGRPDAATDLLQEIKEEE